MDLKPGVAFAAALLAGSGATWVSGAEYPPAVGQPHPNFVLPRIDNREAVSLADFRGRRVLLVHFASW